MKFFSAAVTALLATVGQVEAGYFSPAKPPAAPLAVRNPFLNVWLNGADGTLPGNWPKFWTENVNGWAGFIKVDGKVYNFMGGAPGAPLADQLGMSYTATKTEFLLNVGGKVEMSVKFLSPVTPEDMRRQSIPFSYMDVAVRSLDRNSHKVQIYTDVTGEWASGDTNAVIQWDSTTRANLRSHKFYRKSQDEFQDYNDQASWGTWYYSTEQMSGLTYQIGADVDARGAFFDKGTLANTVDPKFRAVRDNWPVFAYSRDLGKVRGGWKSTVFSIGIAQQNHILFAGTADTPQKLPSLWTSYFNTEADVVSFFHADYQNATVTATAMDNKVQRDSQKAGGDDYATITTLSTRQTFGAIGYTGPTNNIKAWIKEISSDSDIETPDVMFPTMPALVYFNHDNLKWMLDPMYEYQKSGRYPNKWAVHDMGHYPRALGYDKGDDEKMPLEECGNMIILTLLYAQKANDVQYLYDNYKLMDQWAQYLIEDAKIPQNQLSTDDFAGRLVNQTNLAIKGIIALKAMSKVSQMTGNAADQKKYSDVADDYFKYWNRNAINRAVDTPHSILQYGAPDTYNLLYNLYGDKVLNLKFIPQEVYDIQSDFYPTVMKPYGVPLDTRGTLTKSDWSIWAAAMAKPETRDMIISRVAKWLNFTSQGRGLPDLYDTVSGSWGRNILFNCRPVVGGHFALLALK